jgi:histidinol-phosphatase
MVEDEVVVGVVSAPMLSRRWWAVKDGGTFTGKSLYKSSQCQVSDVSKLVDASLSYSSLSGWEERGQLDDFLALTRRCWRTRAYGDFWSYMLVAEGAVDLAAEPELALHDMAALDVIVREAGGRFTGLDGRDGPHGGNALASNGIIHETVLGFLGAVGEDRSGRDKELDPDLEPGQAEGRSGTVFDITSRRRPDEPR